MIKLPTLRSAGCAGAGTGAGVCDARAPGCACAGADACSSATTKVGARCYKGLTA